jgi:lysophospholipase L1-like esterase
MIQDRNFATKYSQFGHNDQKAAANISVEQFEANLKAFISDVIAAGGTPIITTSISRRNYSGGKVVEDLAPQVAAALAVASNTGSAYIDLNKASMAYLNSIGATNSHQYNLATSDNTHLNPSGALVFGTLVGSLLEGSAVGNQITPYLKLNATIIQDIQAGKFILPTGGVS